MKILVLDMATQTGWADTYWESGSEGFQLRRGDSPGMRLIYCKRWLTKKVILGDYDLLVYEQMVGKFKSGAATHVVHSLIGVAEVVAAERGIQISSRTASEIKAHALGTGGKKVKKGKPEMVAQARKRWGHIDIVDDNHSDALHLLDLVLKDLGLKNGFDHGQGTPKKTSAGAENRAAGS